MYSVTLYKRRKKIVIITILAVIAILMNSIAAFNPEIGVITGIAGICILLFSFVRGDTEGYVLLYIFITTLSLEGDIYFLEDKSMTLFNFLNLPVIKGYHVYLLVLLPWVLLLRPSSNNITGNWKINRSMKYYLGSISAMGLIGFAMSLLCVLMNINDIQNSSGFLVFIRRDILKTVWVISLSLLIGKLLVKDNLFSEKLENMLYALLLSIGPSSLFFILSGKTTIFNKTEVIPMGLFFFYGVILTVFILYPHFQKSYLSFFCGVTVSVITLIYPSVLGGKWWLLVFMLPVLILLLLKRQKNNRKIIILIMSLLAVLIVVRGAAWYFSHANELSLNKLYSAKALIEVWKPGWIENMPNSPKHRIDEFLNTLVELMQHPVFLPFGKGYGGNILHHIELKPWTTNGDFSQIEVSEALFFNVHETINWMFLKFGLFGLGFTLLFLYKCVKNIKYSPWLVVGTVWFMFYYNSFISLSFGLASLLMGLYQADQIKYKLVEKLGGEN